MKYLVLILAALAQIATVGWMIGKREYILAKGTPVKFVASPVDPADPFRGRYVALHLDATYTTSNALGFDRRARPWASIEVDAQGYATITALDEKKTVGKTCLRVKRYQQRWITEPPSGDGRQHEFTYECVFPFDRYYMNETAAPEAERRYFQAMRAASGKDNAAHRRDTYLVVRVLDGDGVAEQLYVDGMPVEQLLTGKR